MLISQQNYFNKRYRASLLAPVRRLYDLVTGSTANLEETDLGTLAKSLADMGYIIDVPIQVWGWNPESTMIVRHNQGFTWIPSANMPNIPVMPGITFPGQPSYDPDAPPPNSIRVVIDADEFIPAPDMIVKDKPFNWFYKHDDNGTNGVGSLWNCNANDMSDVGARYEEKNSTGKKVIATYEKVAIQAAHGRVIMWEKTSESLT